MRKGYEKRFNQGDIVYWCSSDNRGKYYVRWGMVDEQFSDAVCVDLLEPLETRYINGIPINEFEDNTYHKLPKGWTYNTRLYELTFVVPDNFKNYKIDITDSENLKKAYADGVLVKSDTIFHGEIETDVNKQGYKIYKHYPMWQKEYETHTSIRPNRALMTYTEAQNEVNVNNAELARIANLSDYDWCVEHIDKTLNTWQSLSDISDEEKQKYREWILNLKNVEDIEVRDFGGNIQWKYYNKKKWNGIDVGS